MQNKYIFTIKPNQPQNGLVSSGEIFYQVKRVINLGNRPWKETYLQCIDNKVNKNKPRLSIVHDTILLPELQVGEAIDISIIFKAPDYPCYAHSEWVIVDKSDPEKHKVSKILCFSVGVLTHSLETSC